MTQNMTTREITIASHDGKSFGAYLAVPAAGPGPGRGTSLRACDTLRFPSASPRDHDPYRARHHRPALRQRPAAPGPPGRLHPGRHLGACAANERRQGLVRLRRRHPWHADHAGCGKGRGHPGNLHRQHPGQPRA
ncbi:hypothetical protein G6F65_021259 [Rhizopus arrhizus]|nr:hypothetical protein G6F65_021259 [Rhizopus arrhizus]